MKRSLKILMLTNGMDIGGVETHILELSKELINRGHEVAIASNGGVYEKNLEELGIRHYTMPLHAKSIPALTRNLRSLNKILKNEPFDVVHAHARIPALMAQILHRKYSFAYVTTAHFPFLIGGALRRLTFWGQKVIAVSDDLRQYLQKNWNIASEKIYITVNGIDTEKFRPMPPCEAIRSELKLGDGPTIVHISRLARSNSSLAAEQLIQVFPSLAASVPDIQLIIVGDGNHFADLKMRADQINQDLGRRSIILTGPRTDIKELISVGDIFVGVSRAALEAMSEAKPVILSGNNGYSGIFTAALLEASILNNFTCRGFPTASDQQLIRDIEKLLLHTCQEEKRKLGTYGREVVKEYYSVRKMTDVCVNVYESARNERLHTSVLGIPFENIRMADAVDMAMQMMDENKPHMICTPNPEIVMYARKDPELKEILLQSDMNVPDGVGIVWGSRFQPVRINERVPGIELAYGILKKMRSTEHTVYFLGAAPGIAETAMERMKERFPGLKTVGSHHGYFKPEEEDAIIAEIRSRKPSLLLVCLGCPKQEKWIAAHANELGVPLCIGLGGSFDVMSGSKKRAPAFFIKCNLEWLYRIFSDPTRLKRIWQLPAFIIAVLKDAIRKK